MRNRPTVFMPGMRVDNRPHVIAKLVEKIGFSTNQFAALFGVHRRTFERYLSDSPSATPAPHAVLVLLYWLAEGKMDVERCCTWPFK